MSGRFIKSLARLSSGSVAANRCAVLSRHLSPPTSPSVSMAASSGNAVANFSNSAPEPDALFSTVKGAGQGGRGFRLMTLNRPKALNSLNQNMAKLLRRDLEASADDPNVMLVVIEGSGEKAFCAGGDIRALTEAGKVGGELATEFFIDEYTLNYMTGTCKKPYVALIDGITMGGGVGLSVHGPLRVATEHTLFAMPETFIGLFPDVGGSYFLPRLPGRLGMFLALTGQRLRGRDVFHAGIATHFVSRNRLPALKQELAAVCGARLTGSDLTSDLEVVRGVLNSFHTQSLEVDDRPFTLQPHRKQINSCFSKSSVEEILQALKNDDSEWSQQQLETLSKMSPTSMKVTHHELIKGAKMSFAECFKMEYRMSQAFMAGTDFYEGVRAVIVEKDNAPKWTPPTLEEVSEELVLRHFAELPSDKELQL